MFHVSQSGVYVPVSQVSGLCPYLVSYVIYVPVSQLVVYVPVSQLVVYVPVSQLAVHDPVS